VNAALAAEGAIFSQSRLFPQPVNSAGGGQLYIKARSSPVLQNHRLGNYLADTSGRCLLAVYVPFFLIFLREHYGREWRGGLAS
jgi:hypothetical protein